jgi:hypothetical protein
MKGIWAVLSAAIAVLVIGSHCFAGHSPIAISHQVTGYTQQGIEFSLHVVNTGSDALEEISLSLVPQPPLVMERTTVKVGTLAPGQTVDVQLRTPNRLKQEGHGKGPVILWWSGKALDAAGNAVQFPVKSRPEVSHD